MKNKKARIAFTIIGLTLAGIGYATDQTWLYMTSVMVSSVGVMVVNDKK